MYKASEKQRAQHAKKLAKPAVITELMLSTAMCCTIACNVYIAASAPASGGPATIRETSRSIKDSRAASEFGKIKI
jgi:hypothetical protein